MISILIPTRKRSHVLDKLVCNITETSSDVNNFEILFKCDTDDLNSINTVQRLSEQYTNIRYLVNPRPEGGHKDLHIMYNELSNLAIGQLLWIYNDDARILTSNWDSIVLRQLTNQPRVFRFRYKNFKNEYLESCNIFPMVHRKIVELQGSIGLHSSIDIQYEMLCSHFLSLEIYENQVEIIHGEDMLPSEYLADGLPPFNPQDIRDYSNQIRQYAELIHSHGFNL